MPNAATTLIPLILLACAALGAATRAGASTVALERVAGGIEAPVAIAHAGDGSGRLFVAALRGRIVILDGDSLLPTPSSRHRTARRSLQVD